MVLGLGEMYPTFNHKRFLGIIYDRERVSFGVSQATPKVTRVVRSLLPKKSGKRMDLLMLVTSLLRNGAIRPVPQEKRSDGFYSTLLWIQRHRGVIGQY